MISPLPVGGKKYMSKHRIRELTFWNLDKYIVRKMVGLGKGTPPKFNVAPEKSCLGDDPFLLGR